MNLKQHKSKLIVSSILILLPIFAGLLIWNQLPDIIPTHWGPTGEPDGWSSKEFAVFGIPLFLFAIHWGGIWVTTMDKRNKNQSVKIVGLIFWICPLISFLGCAAVYMNSLDIQFDMVALPCGLVGIIFIVIGNYSPKCKHNYTIGIKLPWTLASEENWNATHRFASKIWVIGGLALFLLMFLPTEYTFLIMMVIMAVLVLIPTVYSYLYARKNG